ncbi:hypothetical protein A2G06_17025 (plasmid) [Geobacter anodireducens]|nr:hypothetical protein A2G06_17025 [Geobacter anodireducens]
MITSGCCVPLAFLSLINGKAYIRGETFEVLPALAERANELHGKAVWLVWTRLNGNKTIISLH